MGLALKVKANIVGCGFGRDLTNGPWGVVGQVRGKDTNTQLPLDTTGGDN